MSENKLNVIVPKDYNGAPIEVVLREGEAPVALAPKEPERVVINGTIDEVCCHCHAITQQIQGTDTLCRLPWSDGYRAGTYKVLPA